MVVPIVLQKLPEAFRLTITRGADFLNWSMEELLSTFLKELELREDHYYAMFSVGNTQNRKDINTLYMKQEVENCAFCRGRYAPANCKKVNDVNAPKNILIKYSRCFKCLQRGHRAQDYKLIELCNKCGKSHHISICEFVISRLSQQSMNLKLDQKLTLLHVLLAPVVFLLVREIM